MSSRSSLRRKAVLPVTITRDNSLHKEFAYTLDVTKTSARLGGLSSVLKPGEIIELQRGALKAKFKVFWMGAPGSTVAGQAGISSLEPAKCIWSVPLCPDEADLAVDAMSMRNPMAAVSTAPQFPMEKRKNPRYPCSEGVSLKTNGSTFPIYGEIKDISAGGVYVELLTPLMVGTRVTLKLTVEELGQLQTPGIVRTSYPLLGMGLCFTNLSIQDEETIARMIRKIRLADAVASAPSLEETRLLLEETPLPSVEDTDIPSVEATTKILTLARDSRLSSSPLRLDEYSALAFANACESLTAGLDAWKSKYSPEEIKATCKAVGGLHKKLLLAIPAVELADYFSTIPLKPTLTQ
jgi:hypothetical protein